MKKLIIILFLFIFFFLTSNNNFVIAQIPSPTGVPGSGISLIPGITCGNAVSETPDARKCCSSQTQYDKNSAWNNAAVSASENISGIFSLIKVLSGGQYISSFIDFITNIKDYALELKRTISPIPCPLGYPSTQDQNDPSCMCLTATTPTPITALKNICNNYNFSNPGEKGACEACANAPGVWTGLGCVYGDTGEFLRKTVFGVAVGLAGVIALLCIIYATFTLQTSRGNPEKIKKAQELLTSCIMGLMLILFSVFILRLIGVSILKIPGFG